MAAGINDKFKKVSADNSYAVATTVKTARTAGGGTTLEAFDLSKWPDATAVSFLTYRKTTDPVTNVTTVTNRTGWTALVNTGSNTLTNLTVAPGYTDLGHQEGDYIEPVQMSKWANDLVDGILVSHNQDGTLKNSIVTASKLNLTTSDAGNGWTKINLGRFSLYTRRVTLESGPISSGAHPAVGGFSYPTNENNNTMTVSRTVHIGGYAPFFVPTWEHQTLYLRNIHNSTADPGTITVELFGIKYN